MKIHIISYHIISHTILPRYAALHDDAGTVGRLRGDHAAGVHEVAAAGEDLRGSTSVERGMPAVTIAMNGRALKALQL